MRFAPRSTLPLAAVVAATLAGSTARADEGMWPLNLFPREALRAAHGFAPDDAWLHHAMRASVRLGSGGSGSFVSARGLVMTNHHVASDCIQKLSNRPGSPDLMAEGFLARTVEEELRCPDLEINRLREIREVTARVEAAAKDAGDEAKAHAARKAEMARIEKECVGASALRCDVVTLHAGARYDLYVYEKHTDVRLVYAPEVDVAAFGGDRDNFDYPRHGLDVTFLRVHEGDRPLEVEQFFPFSVEGATEGMLAFVAGHPGSTDRFAPTAKLEALRDVVYPFMLQRLEGERRMLAAFMERGEAEARVARDQRHKVENALKAIGGYQAGLKDRALMREVARRERALMDGVDRLPEAERARLREAWPKLADAYRAFREQFQRHAVLEGRFGLAGPLAGHARTLLRAAAERSKPNEVRLPEHRDSARASLELRLFSPAPVDLALQIDQLTLGLENLRRVLGPKDPVVRAVLGARSPAQVARAALEGTTLVDVAERRRLADGGQAAIDAAKDPLIELARALDPAAREVRARLEDEVESVERACAGRIAEARRAVHGEGIYPDATFTLRLSHGVVKGYGAGRAKAPWATDFAGMFAKSERRKNAAPDTLPRRWLEARERLDLATPLDFVSTHDIIGGNSGSPVFDRDLRVVGLIFDGNLPQIANRFLYRDGTQRAISVHSRAILAALRGVHGGEALAAELTGGR